MNTRKIHIVPSILLAVLLLFGSTPKELIHLFADHQDTIHSFHKDGELTIEPEHHHCNFLSYALPLFIAAENPVIHFQTSIVYPPVYGIYSDYIFYKEVAVAFLRGPPSFFS